MQITAIRLALSSTAGTYDHRASSVAVGLKLLDTGADPTGLPGILTWPLTMEGGRLAVWVCPTDPQEALAWPRDPGTAGLFVVLLAGLVGPARRVRRAC